MNNPICFALDGMGPGTAQRYVNMLEDHVGAFKVGLELFVRAGELPRTKRPIVLDLKLHDIPETVAGAVSAGGDRGAKFMTLHIQQRKALEAAVKAAEPFGITLLGVTVLTSMTEDDLRDLKLMPYGPGVAPDARVIDLAMFAHGCGLRGFVCSPREVGALSQAYGDSFFLVPGIRPAGSSLNDQQRVGTPAQAVRDGASLLVIGRPIRDAADCREAAASILKEIEGVQVSTDPSHQG